MMDEINLKRIGVVAAVLAIAYLAIVGGLKVYEDHRYAQKIAEWERGCEEDSAMECMWIGLLHIDGRYVDRDVERGREFLRKSCDLGLPEGCNDLGWDYVEPASESVDPEPQRAVPHFRRACEKGLPLGCENLARLYRDGMGVERDRGKAAAHYEMACGAERPDSCIFAGYLIQGLQDPPEVERIVALFEKACEVDQALCSELALLHFEGKLVPEDHDRADELFEKACDVEEPRIECGE